MAERSSAAERPVILVDGSAYLYRAFHAMPPLTNARGRPTGAVYGVANMLRKLVAEHAPRRMAVVFDASGKTFREDLYAEYKANRDAMPDDMRVQIEPLHDLVRALGMPLVVVDGVEADDVIGTYAVQATALGLDTIISTGDKDMAQLVDDHVTLVNTMTGTVMDAGEVARKFGVTPAQITDYLALVGDTSDNIPGVPGCGPKTAAKWLAEHGDLETVIAQADSVKGKIGEKLRASLEHLPLSKDLARIRLDVDVPLAVSALELGEPDRERLATLYDELEFRSWRRELDDGQPALPGSVAATVSAKDTAEVPVALRSNPVEAHYETVLDDASFCRWLERLERAPLFAFDTETTSLDYREAEIVGVSFAVAPGEAAYVPLAHTYEGVPAQLDRDDVLARLAPLLSGDRRTIVGQHLKYDANVLRNHGIELRNIAHDTMLQSYVLDSTATRHDMDSLARKYLGRETIRYEAVAGRGAKQLRFDQVEIEHAAPYAAEDADVTLQLHGVLWPQLEAVPSLAALYRDIELPLVPVLSRIEYTGVRIDIDMLAAQGEKIHERIDEAEAEAYRVAEREFNLGSPKQIQEILFDELKLPVLRKTPKGQPSTAEDVLEQLSADYPLPALILKHRGLTKLVSTYIDKLPRQVSAASGRVHTSYNQAVASTGRLSSTDPNLQNIPVRTDEGRRIREAFIAADGYRLLAADYSQIELRIMAHLSGDRGLLGAFEERLDIHRATASEVFGVPLSNVDDEQRRSAKAINFGLIYGMSAFGLAKQLGIPRGEAQDYIELYFARYPGVRQYMDETRARAKSMGYVETVFGRRLYLPDINARNQQLRSYAERTAINAPMQGTAADIIKRAMIAVDSWLTDHDVDARIIMQVHDELVLEVPAGDGEAIGDAVRMHMQQAAELAVPLEVDLGLGNSWEEAH